MRCLVFGFHACFGFSVVYGLTAVYLQLHSRSRLHSHLISSTHKKSTSHWAMKRGPTDVIMSVATYCSPQRRLVDIQSKEGSSSFCYVNKLIKVVIWWVGQTCLCVCEWTELPGNSAQEKNSVRSAGAWGTWETPWEAVERTSWSSAPSGTCSSWIQQRPAFYQCWYCWSAESGTGQHQYWRLVLCNICFFCAYTCLT